MEPIINYTTPYEPIDIPNDMYIIDDINEVDELEEEMMEREHNSDIYWTSACLHFIKKLVSMLSCSIEDDCDPKEEEMATRAYQYCIAHIIDHDRKQRINDISKIVLNSDERLHDTYVRTLMSLYDTFADNILHYA